MQPARSEYQFALSTHGRRGPHVAWQVGGAEHRQQASCFLHVKLNIRMLSLSMS